MQTLKPAWQWGGLAAASLLLGGFLHWTRLPAALLLGPMVVAVGFALSGATIRVPRIAFVSAQAIVGLLVAHAVTMAMLGTILAGWPVMLASVAATVGASTLVGWGLTRYGGLPGATAAWGTAPGGAAAMVAMSEEFGGDPRLVALMQYVRVLAISATLPIVSRLWFGAGSGLAPTVSTSIDPGMLATALSFAATLGVAAVSVALAMRLPIPAGSLLIPIVVGAVLHASDLVALTLPQWFLWLAYAGIGWSIGLRFNRDVTRASLTALPQIVLATFLMMGLCAGAGLGLVAIAGIDPLTAFLATAPGGLDTVAIIAASSNADLSFVVALQTLRLFSVILVGPYILRFVSRAARGGPPPR